MIVRAVRVNLRVALGGHRALWLVMGLVVLWLFAFHLYNPWDILLNATDQNSYVFVVIPVYLLILNVDLLQPWHRLTALRMRSSRTWWWAHVLTAGAIAVLMAIGLVGLTVLVGTVSHQWSWQWGTFGQHSEPPAVLANPPWNVPWHWGLLALGYFTLGLWAVGVMRHMVALWWRAPWLTWLALMTLALTSRALNGTAAHAAIWFLPGAQFSYWFHWTGSRAHALRWSLGYGTVLWGLATLAGGLLAGRARWVGRHGDSL